MTKISRYVIDDKVTGSDKWIGSDAQTQYTTKNFTPTKLAVYFNENQVIDIGTPIRYKYDILEVGDTRLPGTITFEPQVGTPYSLSSISSFILSKYTLKGNDVTQYLNFLIGSNVLIYKADDINIFGLYKVVSLVENIDEPDFFDVVVSYTTGNGSIVEDKDYLVSLIDGGDIPTKTSDLINDGEDGVHPFITASDVTPQVNSDWDATSGVAEILNKPIIPTKTSDLTNDGEDGINPFITLADIPVIQDLQSVLDNGNTAYEQEIHLISSTENNTFTLDVITTDGATRAIKVDYNYPGDNANTAVQFTSNGAENPDEPGTGKTLEVNNISSGNAIEAYSLNGKPIITYGNGPVAIESNLGNSGKGLVINSGASSTGNPIEIVKETTTKLSVNQEGEITAEKLIKDGGQATQFLKADGSVDNNIYLTSVGLTMPVAFNVANSPLTSDGTIAVSAAGTSSQYIRGDGQLATLPTGAGGGSTVAYYLNGSINASVAGYKQLSNTATIGGGTDFTLVGNGLIAQFLTDIGNPNRLEIPGGAWNFEMFFQASSAGGSQKFYVELLKYNGTTFTSIASSVSVAEEITGGTTIDLYLTSLAVPTTPLLVTDRLAIRVYIVDNSGGRTITLHTEDNTLCEIITTFSGGVTSLNGLTANTQYLAVGTTGTDFNISSVTDTHTFNLPTASATNRGALSSTDWTAFNGKFNLPSLTSGSVLFSNGTTIAQKNSNFFWDNTNNRLGIGTNAPTNTLNIIGSTTAFDVATWKSSTGLTGYLGSGPTQIAIATGASGSGSYLSMNTNFFTASSGTTFSVRTANAERMTINSSGNVLINTTTDNGGKLQIKAPGALSTDIALRVRNSADTLDMLIINGLGNASIGQGTTTLTNRLTVQDVNATSVAIELRSDSNPRVGSTFNTARILAGYSSGTASFLDLQYAGGAFPYTYTTGLRLNSVGNTLIGTTVDQGGKLQIKAPGALSTDIALRVRNSADTGDLLVTNGLGNVGIGTATPNQKLEVIGNAIFRSTSRIDINTAQTAVVGVLAGTSLGTYGNFSLISSSGVAGESTDISYWNGGTYYPAFRISNVASGFSNLLLMKDGGNVGIGTNVPSVKLQVEGGGTYIKPGVSGTTALILEPVAAASLSWGYSGNIVGSLSQTSTDAVIRAGSGKNLTFETLVGGERMRINSAGNTLINTTVDQGGKLQIKAPGALSTDIALRVRNSADTGDLFQVQGNGAIVLSSGASFYTLGNNLNFRSNLAGGSGFVLDVQSFNSLNNTNTEQGFGMFSGTYAPTSGTGTFNGFKVTPIINQTGGANGVTRGLYINPTLTAAADFRAIETTAGNVILGSMSGKVGIGTTAPVASAKVQIDSTTQGFLPPRMTNAQRLLIATPAVGLCVYCTDAIEGLYINKSTGWTYIG